MISPVQPHSLLILSQHCDIYKQLINELSLPGLSLVAATNPNQVISNFNNFDIVFGEPSLVSMILNQLPNLKWVQATWAGVDPLLEPGKRTDYVLTNIRSVYGQLISEYVFGYMLAVERKILTRWKLQQVGIWDSSKSGTLKGKLLV